LKRFTENYLVAAIETNHSESCLLQLTSLLDTLVQC